MITMMISANYSTATLYYVIIL